jgi:hypothetical protein
MEKEKVIKIMEEIISYLKLNPKQFSESLGFDRPQAIYDILNPSKKVGISKNMAEKINYRYPYINKMYLLTGEGDMINKNNIGRDNYGVQGNGSQNISGSMVSVTMPESGTQKIIKPTGEVEIHRLDPSDKSNSEELDRLKQRIQDLERIIAEKDATIQSKDDTIKTKDELISFLRADRQ